MPVLLVRDGNETKRIEFERGKDVLIGRAADNDISFPQDCRLSKKHCQLCYYDEKDCYFISDLNSTNGTWLNQNRISTDIILSDNDKIQAGNVRILFKYDSFDSPTKTRKIMKLVKKPKNGIFEQTDTLKLSKALLQQQDGAQPSPDDAILPQGTVVGSYVLKALVSQSDLACRYQAVNQSDNSQVILTQYKLKFPEGAPGSQAFKECFGRLAQIDNPYFTRVIDFGVMENYCYHVIDVFDSQSLAGRIAQSAPYPEYDALCIAYTIAAALENAFSNYKIIHGMLSPDRINIDAANNMLITELGTASWLKMYCTRNKTLIQPAYASPEEITQQELGWRSDQYALGVIFFQLLTGYLPFDAETIEEVYNLHVTAGLPHPQAFNPNIWVSELSLQIMHRMTAKNPDDRYQSWQEILDAFAASYEKFETTEQRQAEETSTDTLGRIFDSYYDESEQ